MGLDIFFYATKEDIATDELEEALLNKDEWNAAYEGGKIKPIAERVRKNYPLYRYVCTSFAECDGGFGDLNCELYPINYLIEPVLALAKNREFDAFDLEDDELGLAEEYLAEIEQVFTECKKYADDGFTVVFHAWY